MLGAQQRLRPFFCAVYLCHICKKLAYLDRVLYNMKQP